MELPNFDSLKKAFSDAVQVATKVTKNAAAATKANINLLSEQDKLKKAYAELGKLCYRDYIAKAEPDDAEYLPIFESITELTKSVDTLRTAVDGFRTPKAPEEEAPAEEKADLQQELEDLHKELDDLEKELHKLDGLEESAPVFEVVDETSEKKPE